MGEFVWPKRSCEVNTILCLHPTICFPLLHADWQTNGQTNGQTDGQTDGLAGGQTDRQTDTHTGRQTHRRTHVHMNTSTCAQAEAGAAVQSLLRTVCLTGTTPRARAVLYSGELSSE